MFDIGVMEFAVLGVVALLVFGPDKLPIVARQAGNWLRQARSAVAASRRELTETIGLDPGTDPKRLINDALLGEDPEDARPRRAQGAAGRPGATGASTSASSFSPRPAADPASATSGAAGTLDDIS